MNNSLKALEVAQSKTRQERMLEKHIKSAILNAVDDKLHGKESKAIKELCTARDYAEVTEAAFNRSWLGYIVNAILSVEVSFIATLYEIPEEEVKDACKWVWRSFC